MADATVRKMCQVARQFFKAAVSHRLISENPFSGSDIKTATRGNAERFHFISQDDARKVRGACPNAEWRLIFGLSRWGGLRCPSEHLSLKWEHVNWEHNRLTIPSPKTAHHEGHAERLIPLFPELRVLLEAVFDEAPEGAVDVITRYRSTNANLRTQLERIIRGAGLPSWERLFHNLRASRQTELADQYPEHVVSGWMGNSVSVARKHYLNTLDEHFERAILGEEQPPQNPPHSAPQTAENTAFRTSGNKETPAKQGFSGAESGRYKTRNTVVFQLGIDRFRGGRSKRRSDIRGNDAMPDDFGGCRTCAAG